MFRRINNDKISNVLNYFASQIDHLFKTKTLKIHTFWMVETSIKETGTPVTWLIIKFGIQLPLDVLQLKSNIKKSFVIRERIIITKTPFNPGKKFNTDRNLKRFS
jgi:hypothetical protein